MLKGLQFSRLTCHRQFPNVTKHRLLSVVQNYRRSGGPDLRELEQWAADWDMQFNPTKCHVLSANKRSHHHQYFYELCGVVLKSVESEKYLGMTLSSDLSWSSHIAAICTKANQKLGFIKRNLKGTPRELNCLAYVAFVRSAMEYASIIWDPHFIKDSDALERVQKGLLA